MPIPSSMTEMTIAPSSATPAFTVTVPPGGVNLAAFDSRLRRICFRRGSSTKIVGRWGRLVAHAGEKFALGPVRGPGRRQRVAQPLLRADHPGDIAAAAAIAEEFPIGGKERLAARRAIPRSAATAVAVYEVGQWLVPLHARRGRAPFLLLRRAGSRGAVAPG